MCHANNNVQLARIACLLGSLCVVDGASAHEDLEDSLTHGGSNQSECHLYGQIGIDVVA